MIRVLIHGTFRFVQCTLEIYTERIETDIELL